MLQLSGYYVAILKELQEKKEKQKVVETREVAQPQLGRWVVQYPQSGCILDQKIHIEKYFKNMDKN